MSSLCFPNINLTALKQWAIATAAKIHPLKVARGKPQGKTEPKIQSCEDVYWAGENMILITFERESMPMGPNVMLAHFPSGRSRLTTQALVGMTDTVARYRPGRINTPKIYAYLDNADNDVGAEVVLMEKVPGQNLEELWPTLSGDKQFMVLVKIAEMLCNMFNFRGSLICTDLLGTEVDTRPPVHGESRLMTQKPLLLLPPLNQGPLLTLPPQAAVETTAEYLDAIIYRIERLFGDDGEPTPENIAARISKWPGTPNLTYLDVERVRATWKRLATLVPYHTGGFFIPKTLPRKAREVAYSILQSQQHGIRHSKMEMRRFIVNFGAVEEGSVSVTLTGWEHAYRAPLWSCARLPPWFTPSLDGPGGPIPNEQKEYFRDLFVGRIMTDDRMLPFSWQWFVAFIYGEAERWFEDCISLNWFMRNHVEFLLPYLQRHWELHRPDVEFPLNVGKEYAAPGDTELDAATREEVVPDPGLVKIDHSESNIGATLGDDWKVWSVKWQSYAAQAKKPTTN